MQLDLQILGGFQLSIGHDKPVILGTRKAQALIAYLAMRPGYPHSRDKLAELLWGDRGDRQARHSLRQTLVSIRKALPARLSNLVGSDSGALAIDPSIRVDAVLFEQLAEESSTTSMKKAAALYQGPFLDGLTVSEKSFEDWMLMERERLQAICMEVLMRMARYHSEEGDPEIAVQTAVKLLSIEPLQENVHRMLMRLYLRLGRRDAALRQYQMCAHLLDRELGMQPDTATRDAYREILNLPASGKTEEAAATVGAPRILIVEDDLVTRVLLEGFLQEEGYRVVQAQDGAEALIELGRNNFNLVLLDLNMPTIDGFKLLEIMAAKAMTPPTICITALVGEEFEVKGFRLGAVDFIRKPIRKEVLQLRVRNVIGRSGAAPMAE